MPKLKYHVGLEIGTSSTKMVVAEVKPDLSVKILGLGKVRSTGVRKGEIQDPNYARSCIKEALIQAEEQSNITIGSVFLAVSGGHIRGLNSRGKFRLPEESNTVKVDHIIEAEDIACDVELPSDHAFIHTLTRNYKLDDQSYRVPPVQMSGETLEADLHLVHGITSRVKNTMRVAKECKLDIEDIVFSPLASAQIALNKERREEGALVVDIGGGTTDYTLYLRGAIFSSGCIPIGGDHITNDIHLVSQITLSQAERLKVEQGNVSGDAASLAGYIYLDDDQKSGEIERKTLNRVIAVRLHELFKLIKQRLPEGVENYIGTGIYLSGGVSKTPGIAQVVNKVFRLPVFRPDQGEEGSTTAYFKDPELFTVLGLIRYAQILDQDEDEPSSSPLDFFSKLFGKT